MPSASPQPVPIRAAFEAAHIQYGRADYALVSRRPQIFEINMNGGWSRPATPSGDDASSGMPPAPAPIFQAEQRRQRDDLARARGRHGSLPVELSEPADEPLPAMETAVPGPIVPGPIVPFPVSAWRVIAIGADSARSAMVRMIPAEE